MTDQLDPLLVRDCAWVWCTSFNLSLYLICFQWPLSCLHSLDLICFQKPLSCLHSLDFFPIDILEEMEDKPWTELSLLFLVSRIWFWRQWICTHRQGFTKINVGWWYDINVCGRRMSGQNNMAALSFFWHCWLKRSGQSLERDWCCPLNCDHSNIESKKEIVFCWGLFLFNSCYEGGIPSLNHRKFLILCSSAFNQLYHTSLYVWVTRDESSSEVSESLHHSDIFCSEFI